MNPLQPLNGDEAAQAIRFDKQIDALKADNARQAIIAHRRDMKAQRKFAADNAPRIEAEWNALRDPVADARDEQRRFAAENGPRIDADWEMGS